MFQRVSVCVIVCVCVSVREQERERVCVCERERHLAALGVRVRQLPDLVHLITPGLVFSISAESTT